MTDEEIKRLAQEIVNQKGGFYVDPEEHYKQHERLDKLLNMFDSAGSILFKTIVAAMCIGVFALAAIGMGWHK